MSGCVISRPRQESQGGGIAAAPGADRERGHFTAEKLSTGICTAKSLIYKHTYRQLTDLI